MNGPAAARLPGERLHLSHGPIDLVIGAEGAREAAFAAAARRFAAILDELMEELPLLRRAVAEAPLGAVARRMHAATRPHGAAVFVTPMAAVAGAVADEVLVAMRAAGPLRRAYVNNGGDIALHLEPGAGFRVALAGLDGVERGRFEIGAENPSCGVATSGRGGRSLSLGIAESVTVLADCAASADAAATLIANAVDLPGHPAIRRAPANRLRQDSDLGERLAVDAVGPLSPREAEAALDAGLARAEAMRAAGLIHGAALILRGRMRRTGPAPVRAGELELEGKAR